MFVPFAGISVIWHVVGTFSFMIALLAVAPSHQSAKCECAAAGRHSSAACTPQHRQPCPCRCASSRLTACAQCSRLSGTRPADVFTEFSKPDVGIGSSALIFMLGLLMSAFTLTG